jgi:ADP-L-glycero-D-manno-heptose 6-epimerase
MQTTIITGGFGFIGANLVAELLRRHPDTRPIVIDDCRSGSFANLVEACDRAGVGAFPGEVIAEPTAAIDWEALIEDASPTAVFHLGAITDTTISDERKMIDDNTAGFDAMILACAESAVPLVYASSAATYGTPPEVAQRLPFPESSAGKPNNIYGFSKWLMENIHTRCAQEWEADTGETPHVVGLRYFNVFGPGEARKGKMASMAYQITTQMLAGNAPRLFEHGEQARDQVPVEDVVDCTIAAAAPGVTSGAYNLGSGRLTSFNEIADAVREGVGISEAECPTEYFEMPAKIRAFYQDFTCADMSRTKEGLHWSPQHDPIEATRRYAAWLASSRRMTEATA